MDITRHASRLMIGFARHCSGRINVYHNEACLCINIGHLEAYYAEECLQINVKLNDWITHWQKYEKPQDMPQINIRHYEDKPGIIFDINRQTARHALILTFGIRRLVSG